ncbi:pyridoxamine 5'-phosphate oxidase family protein [Streptomyces sp. NPDC047043]|uniref:pyridoxamine 5'-phosphate oxidase family protein n=1 Tax=Streptomyces sp. NPDC047043 TaxID=3154497 RepID=UPI0033EBBC6A
MKNESRVTPTARMIELGREESLALLASVPMGRVGFTQWALPVIRPVNHLVDGDAVVIRTHGGSALLNNAGVDQVVVYEADEIDPQTRTGWSVMVSGPATRITAPVEVARYRQLLLPWIDMDMDHVVRISAEIVTGYRLAGTRA